MQKQEEDAETTKSESEAAEIFKEEPVKHFLNLRVHPLYTVLMTSPETKAGVRGDVDILVHPKFSVGPAVEYFSYFDKEAALYAPDRDIGVVSIYSKHRSVLDLGINANIHLTKESSEGGLILRPNFFYVMVSERLADKDTEYKANTKNGLRAGADLTYQWILDSGFIFEAGGGLTFYLIKDSASYKDFPGTDQEYYAEGTSTRSLRILPKITATVGWSF